MENSLLIASAAAQAVSSNPQARSAFGKLISAGVNFYVKNKQNTNVVSVVMPTLKSTICQKFNAEHATTGDWYALDLEGQAIESIPEPQRTQLKELRAKDIIQYNNKAFPLFKVYLDDFLAKSVQFNKDTVFVIVCSSRALKHYIGLPHCLYFFPSNVFAGEIIAKSGAIKSIIEFAKKQLKGSKKAITIVSSVEELYKAFCEGVGAEKKM